MEELDIAKQKVDLAHEELILFNDQFHKQFRMSWKLYEREKDKFNLQTTLWLDDFAKEINRAQAVTELVLFPTNHSMVNTVLQANLTSAFLKEKMKFDFNQETQKMNLMQTEQNLDLLLERTSLQIENEGKRHELAYKEIELRKEQLKDQYDEALSEIKSRFSGIGGFINNFFLPVVGGLAGAGIGSALGAGIGLSSTLSTALGGISGALGTYQSLNGPTGISAIDNLTTLTATLPQLTNLFKLPVIDNLLGDSNVSTNNTSSEVTSSQNKASQLARKQKLLASGFNNLPINLLETNKGSTEIWAQLTTGNPNASLNPSVSLLSTNY